MTDKRLDLPSPGSPNFEARVREALHVYLGRTGDPLDKGLTVRDLKALGLLETAPGSGGRILEPGPLIPRPTRGGDEEGEDLTPPPTPTGFALAAGITNVFVEHDPPVYTQGRGHDRTVLYGTKRNEGDPLPTFAQAQKLADFQGEVYAYPSDPATIWHMWITWRTLDGVESVVPAGGLNGLQARTGEDVQRLLDALNGQIGGSALNQELSRQIDESTAGIAYLGTQYGMRVQVAADGRRLVGGYGIMGSNEQGRGPSIDFGVLANRFYVGAPASDGGVSSSRPFIVQTTPTVINGVNVPAGVYIEDGFIKNGTITNAKIANAAIDDAKIASLSANKIRAGAIAVGQYIQSSTYAVGGNQGWRINGDGTAEFREVDVRGGVYASRGSIGGVSISAGAVYTSAYGQGPGFYLGSDGRFSLGAALTWNGSQLTITGNGTFSGALQAATGTFRGALQAASGTFSGTLTAQAINAVQTINIAGEAVTVPGGASGVWSASVSMSTDVATSFMVIGTFTQGNGRQSEPVRLMVNGSLLQQETPIQGTTGAISRFISLEAGTHEFKIQAVNMVGDFNCGISVLGVKR
ncbi:MAG: DUF1983 domain-containing protein [Acidovorax sp.]|nr:DUF1983 domain-containing protein [Acidovorax sp.]